MSLKTTTLDNGIRVVTETVPHVETVTLGVWVDVGTRYEPRPLHGISHLLEHMVFKGTETRTPADIAREIESVGGHLNAYTSREHTTYYARVLKNDLELGAGLLGDILANPVFDGEELTREKEVILQEIGQVQDTPDDLIFDLLQDHAFPGQSLGRSILGTAESVAAFTREDLQQFMKDHYIGKNMVVVAVGNLDHDRIAGIAEKVFGGFPGKRSDGFKKARYKGGESRRERDLEQLHLALGFESCSYLDPDYFACQVYSTLLGGGMSSRLFQEVREKRGYAYSVFSFNATHADTGLFSIYAGTGPNQVRDLLPVMSGEMKALTKTLEEKELERAKTQLKASLLMSLESTTSRMEQIGRQMMIFDRVIPVPELVEKVERVGEKDINRIARQILDKPLTLASIGKAGATPPRDEIQNLFSL